MRYILSLAIILHCLNAQLACQGRIGNQTGSVTLPLTVTVIGGGTISSLDGQINLCASGSGTCTGNYNNGTTVTITPSTSINFFWSTGTGSASGCSGTGPCSFPITQASTILAIFAAGGTIPASPTFSLDLNSSTVYPTTISHGQVRIWDTPGAQWSFIETANNTFGFSSLDNVLSLAFANNVHTAQYGLARTPNWASSNTNLTITGTLTSGVFTNGETVIQSSTGISVTFVSISGTTTLTVSQYTSGTADATHTWVGQTSGAVFTPSAIPAGCAFFTNGNYQPAFLSGQCAPPSDVSADGTGTDLIFRNWVAALVTHAANSTYLTNHAHILYYEIWNEPYATGKFWIGSYDQLIRFAQDAACIINKNNGVGFIQGDPTHSCADVRASVTSVANCCNGAGGVGDPTAEIIMPSYAPASYNLAQCFLYCTPNSLNTCGTPATSCIAGHGGASAIDRINFHAKPGASLETAIAVQVAAVRATLQPADVNKPIDDTEAGFSATGWTCPNPLTFSSCYTDPNMQAGYVERMYVEYYFAGVANDVWYNWSPANGGLGTPQAGQAYTQVYNWMVGSTAPVCTRVGTVSTCTMTSAASVATAMIWDTAQPCGGTPSTCPTASTQTVANHYQSYIDYTGTKFSIPQPGLSPHQVKVNIIPVLLQDTP